MTGKIFKTGAILASLGMITLGAVGSALAQTATVDIISNAAQDGYVAATAAGASSTTNSTAATNAALRVGDSELFFLFFDLLPDRGYRSVLSFATNSIPAGATIDAATLFLTRGGGAGAVDGTFGTAQFEVKKGQYGTTANIEAADFLAASTATGGPVAIGGSDGAQTSTALTGPALAAVNQSGGVNSGITQVKLLYPTLTNNDRGADYIGLYSGNAANTAQRPFLRVTYTVGAGAGLVVSPGNVDFFDQEVDAGPTDIQTLTITNLGATTVTISSLTLGGAQSADFTIETDSGETSLAQNDSRTLEITFDPSSIGTRNAAITVVHSLPSSPLVVPITGRGIQKRISVNFPDLAFGIQDVDAGPTFPREVVITNSGNSDITINEIAIEGTDIADFLIQNDTAEELIAPAGTRTFEVVFDPNFPISTKTADLVVRSDAANDPELTVTMTGSAATGSRRQFGDFNDSGCTDVEDFLFLLDNWQLLFQGTPVDINDFLALLDNWQLGPSCPPAP